MLADILNDLNKLSDADLRVLHSNIVNRLNHQRELNRVNIASSLNIGDAVRFWVKRDHRYVNGKITKINRKTAKVYDTSKSCTWTVSLELLEKNDD
jgi:hypothetical protein